jgi:hypothetical protein
MRCSGGRIGVHDLAVVPLRVRREELATCSVARAEMTMYGVIVVGATFNK